jgi:hypothetical protein
MKIATMASRTLRISSNFSVSMSTTRENASSRPKMVPW